MSNVLDLYDQTMFLGERATATSNGIQCVWVYDRGVDIEGLRRFHRHLQHGRLARRIEPSPLPFGRHRWVSTSAAPELDIIQTPRARTEFDDWLAEQANTPLDAQHGPGWHLAVLPFLDGGAGVSMVVSHSLTDGVGLCQALADAASGRRDPISWPVAGSRRRWRALREDAHQTARDLPDIARAAVAAARFAQRHRSAESPATRAASSDERVALSTTTVFVDAADWDARAQSLGGTSNALLVGLAARLAARVGRLAPDGSVNVTLPVNERTAGDTRANAITNVDMTVDPAGATETLRGIRATVKHALIRSNEEVNERWQLLPLAPLLPRGLARRWVGVSASSPSSVVSSNLGVVDPAAWRPDGADADQFAMRSLCSGLTSSVMASLGGLLVLLSGRAKGRVFVSVLAYQPGECNSNEDVRRELSAALSDFSLTAQTGWRRRPELVGAAPVARR